MNINTNINSYNVTFDATAVNCCIQMKHMLRLVDYFTLLGMRTSRIIAHITDDNLCTQKT